MKQISIRQAGSDDKEFLAASIVEADRSGTDRSAYSALFRMIDADLKELFIRIFGFELVDCEYAVSSFCVAEAEGKPVAACAAWLEEEDSIPSWQYKFSALRSALEPAAFKHLLSLQGEVSGILPSRTAGCMQVESVFVLPEFRGLGLFQQMLLHQKNRFAERESTPGSIQIIAYDNNLAAIRTYEKAGFRIRENTKANSAFVHKNYPSDGMVLMEMKF
jgi:ribosomal protein S18 acetylase RimI-like enzyme